jgi:hypothetical protein
MDPERAPLVADVLVVHQLAMHHHNNSNIGAGSRTTRVGSLISKGAVQRLACEFSVRACVVLKCVQVWSWWVVVGGHLARMVLGE